jgi:5-methylcytosine-specific restriction endonuclease McrA
VKRSNLSRKTRIKQLSAKKRAYDLELSKVRPLVMARCHDICEICHMRRAVVVHHRQRRSQGGGNELNNLMGLCVDCHESCHRDVRWATRFGYLLRS